MILSIDNKVKTSLSNSKPHSKISLQKSANKIETALVEMENDKGISAQKAFQKLRKKIINK